MRLKLFVVLGIAAIFACYSAAQERKQLADTIVINIVGKNQNAKYVKEGDPDQQEVAVVVGQKVKWVNKADTDTDHTASEGTPTMATHRFRSGDIPRGKSYEKDFNQKFYDDVGGKPGGEVVLQYYCERHPKTMKSSIRFKSK